MIVRISGRGQYELPDGAVKRLDALDDELTAALGKNDDRAFRDALRTTIEFVCAEGTLIPPDQVVPSEVIVPPDDIEMHEAGRFFTDEGLMQPLPA